MGDESTSETRDKEVPPSAPPSYGPQEEPITEEYERKVNYLKTPGLTSMKFKVVEEEPEKPRKWFKRLAKYLHKGKKKEIKVSKVKPEHLRELIMEEDQKGDQYLIF
jgi:hypothetical protein